MGTCECISKIHEGFSAQGPQTVPSKVKRLDPTRQEDSFISFSDVSITQNDVVLSNVQKITSQNTIRTIENSKYSKNISIAPNKPSLSDQIQQSEIQIFQKIELRQFYDLKKIIEKTKRLFTELEINQRDLKCPIADQSKIYEQKFIKIHIKNTYFNETCFYRGVINKKMLGGSGEMYFLNGTYYNGEMAKNLFHGEGLFIHSSKDYYSGSWKQNKAQGFGEFHHYQGVIYKGQWINDNQDGIGEEYWPDGAYFKGYFKNGSKKSGKFVWPNENVYDGQFVDNQFSGKGKFTWQNKKSYEGSWKTNLMHGYGIFKWQNGQIFKGNYKAQKKHGKGELILVDGTVIKGNWQNGKLQGESIISKNGKQEKMVQKNGVFSH